jgi:HAD superfamily hydrolase (TIGR01549 family)
MKSAAVIFDLDGTLTRPYLDFDAIREEIGIPSGPILEAIARMAPPRREQAQAILLRHEWEAARHGSLNDGAVEVVAECRRRGHPVAVLTRNARNVVDAVLAAHGLVFDAVRTRDDGAVKPSAEPVLSICSQLQCDPRRSWVVGDYLFDIISGREAGARTILMIGDGVEPEYAAQADAVIRRLSDLLGVVGAADVSVSVGPVMPHSRTDQMGGHPSQ